MSEVCSQCLQVRQDSIAGGRVEREWSPGYSLGVLLGRFPFSPTVLSVACAVSLVTVTGLVVSWTESLIKLKL